MRHTVLVEHVVHHGKGVGGLVTVGFKVFQEIFDCLGVRGSNNLISNRIFTVIVD